MIIKQTHTRFFKKIFLFVGIIVVPVFAVLAINFYIDSKSSAYIFQDTNDLPEAEVALILGAKVFQQGTMSGMLQDRVDTAIDLYEKDKVKKILVSGDHGRENYDEVNTIKNFLLKKGIKSENIFLDHAGFDTYDSLYRAKEIFEVRSVIAVTQNFHLSRTVYIGKELDLEIYGLSADRHSYANIDYNESREVLSKVKAFFDINFHAKPKFLGEKIPISGDSKKSWDEKDISDDKLLDEVDDLPKEKDVLLEVPFTSQAPFVNWNDARKQDGCEEAAVIMAMAWVNDEKLTPKIADEKINEISAFEKKMYGSFYDTNADDTAKRIFKEYFKYDNIEVEHNIDKENIKKELFKGNLVIVPVNGRKLGNPYYTPPGPVTHNLVVIGYDILKKEFITNDPGVGCGEKFRYGENILESALLDYPTGFHETVERKETAMIIIKKSS